MKQNTGKNKIFIVGQMASGKTTVANYLYHNYGYCEQSIARPIYNIVNDLDELSNEAIIKKWLDPYINLTLDQWSTLHNILDSTRRIEHEMPKPRKRLQYLGTDGVRNQISDTIWIELLLGELRDRDNRVVIDDCRFLNEYAHLTANGFIGIGISIDENIRISRANDIYKNLISSNISHASEQEYHQIVANCDVSMVDNNGTKEDLYNQIDLWLEKK